jgi:hypothetical protein
MTTSPALEGTVPMPFLGFPYLVVRIGHTALRHHDVLPTDWPEEALVAVARRQAAANRLDTCVCLAPDLAVAVSSGGTIGRTGTLPTGIIVTDRLITAGRIPETTELAARRAALRDHAERHRPAGYLVGDGLEGGRPPTGDEIARLAWRDQDALPPGLGPCDSCGEPRGDYLAEHGEGNGDPAPRVVTIHCRCHNHNRCAGCGERLGPHRLSAWFWDPERWRPVYVAAYCGLSHECGPEHEGRVM